MALAALLALGALGVSSLPALASWAGVVGVVGNDGSWSDYTSQHCVNSYGGGPQVAVTGWPGGSTLYMSYRVTVGGPRSSPTTIRDNDWSIHNVGHLPQYSCYYFSAHRDWAWDYWNSTSWSANVRS